MVKTPVETAYRVTGYRVNREIGWVSFGTSGFSIKSWENGYKVNPAIVSSGPNIYPINGFYYSYIDTLGSSCAVQKGAGCCDTYSYHSPTVSEYPDIT